jgi:hypothetical protein
MFKAFLKWRDDNNIDAIRNEILYGGMDSAFKFPKGKEILDLTPQIIISANAQDYKGQPLGERVSTASEYSLAEYIHSVF